MEIEKIVPKDLHVYAHSVASFEEKRRIVHQQHVK
jgi:hypothetical protein